MEWSMERFDSRAEIDSESNELHNPIILVTIVSFFAFNLLTDSNVENGRPEEWDILHNPLYNKLDVRPAFPPYVLLLAALTLICKFWDHPQQSRVATTHSLCVAGCYFVMNANFDQLTYSSHLQGGFAFFGFSLNFDSAPINGFAALFTLTLLLLRTYSPDSLGWKSYAVYIWAMCITVLSYQTSTIMAFRSACFAFGTFWLTQTWSHVNNPLSPKRSRSSSGIESFPDDEKRKSNYFESDKENFVVPNVLANTNAKRKSLQKRKEHRKKVELFREAAPRSPSLKHSVPSIKNASDYIVKSPVRHSLYLGLLRNAVTQTISADPALFARRVGGQWMTGGAFNEAWRRAGLDYPKTAVTRIGTDALITVQDILKEITKNRIPGDILDAAPWRGGVAIYCKGFLSSVKNSERRVRVLVSRFRTKYNESRILSLIARMPEYLFRLVLAVVRWVPVVNRIIPSLTKSEIEDLLFFSRHKQLSKAGFSSGTSAKEILDSFNRFDLKDDSVFVNDFKPETDELFVEKIAFLRIGDDVRILKKFYDKLSSGGYVLVDNYDKQNLKESILKFLSEQKKSALKIRTIGDGQRAYWRKL
eukprot:187462_1